MTFFLIYSLKLHETPPALSRFSCCMPVFSILIDIIELTCYININLKTDTDTNGGSLTEFYYAGTALLKPDIIL